MSILLNLPPELEGVLVAEADRLGMPVSEFAIQVLSGERSLPRLPRTGAELIAYWQREGVVGSRPDIVDAPAHARALREKAQRREQS